MTTTASHQAVDHDGVVWFSAPTADELRLTIAAHYEVPDYTIVIHADEVFEEDPDTGSIRSSWTYVINEDEAPNEHEDPIPSTIAFLHGVHARLNDFLAEGFHTASLATDFPQSALVADFLHIEYDAPSLSRTELDIVRAVMADLLANLS